MDLHGGIEDSNVSIPGWRIVQTEKDFTKWIMASGLVEVIKPELIKDPHIKLFLYEDSEVLSGFICKQSSDVVGVSNVFTNGNDIKEVWSVIPLLVASVFPNVPIVGYEHDEDLKMARLTGWKSLGSLYIWIKR